VSAWGKRIGMGMGWGDGWSTVIRAEDRWWDHLAVSPVTFVARSRFPTDFHHASSPPAYHPSTKVAPNPSPNHRRLPYAVDARYSQAGTSRVMVDIEVNVEEWVRVTLRV
jgi:hypothetical protein